MDDFEKTPPRPVTKPKGQQAKLYAISLSGYIGQNLNFVYVPYFAIALGASYSEQGLVTSVRTLGNSVTQSFWGSTSDKRGRRPILMMGYIILALTALAYTTTSRISLFLGLLAIQGFCGYSVVAGGVWNSTMGDIASERERGTIIGKITSLGVFGSVPVIILFGYLIDRQGLTSAKQYHLPFYAAGAVIIITILLIVSLRETLTTKPTGDLPSPWHIVKKYPRFRRFLMIDIAFYAVMALTWPLFPFVVREVVHATNAQLSTIWAAWMCFMAFGQRVGGALSDRMGRRPFMIFSRSLLFVVPLGFALSSRWPFWWLLMIAQCFGGLGWGLSVLLENMIALDLAPTDQKALFAGTTFTITGVAGFFGSLFSGTMTEILAVQLGPLSALVLMLYFAAICRFILGIAHIFIDETAPSKRRIVPELPL